MGPGQRREAHTCGESCPIAEDALPKLAWEISQHVGEKVRFGAKGPRLGSLNLENLTCPSCPFDEHVGTFAIASAVQRFLDNKEYAELQLIPERQTFLGMPCNVYDGPVAARNDHRLTMIESALEVEMFFERTESKYKHHVKRVREIAKQFKQRVGEGFEEGWFRSAVRERLKKELGISREFDEHEWMKKCKFPELTGFKTREFRKISEAVAS